jgi:hypothetical protein
LYLISFILFLFTLFTWKHKKSQLSNVADFPFTFNTLKQFKEVLAITSLHLPVAKSTQTKENIVLCTFLLTLVTDSVVKLMIHNPIFRRLNEFFFMWDSRIDYATFQIIFECSLTLQTRFTISRIFHQFIQTPQRDLFTRPQYFFSTLELSH